MAFDLLIHRPGQPEDQVRVFPVPIANTVIGRGRYPDAQGRAADAYLVLESGYVSRRHAVFVCSGLECWIVDLGSKHGTMVNGEAIPEQVRVALKSGDEIFIAHTYRLMLRERRERRPPPPPRQVKLPPDEPPPELPVRPQTPRPYDGAIPPGCQLHSLRFLQFLPEIYRTPVLGYVQASSLTGPWALAQSNVQNGQRGQNGRHDAPPPLISRLLALFESVFLPLEWFVDDFDIYLDPKTAPAAFLPWLGAWFGLEFDDSWSEAQRREMLTRADELNIWRGTKRALAAVLAVYTGVPADDIEIDDDAADLPPYAFRVRVPLVDTDMDPAAIRAIIDAYAPAHTTCIDCRLE